MLTWIWIIDCHLLKQGSFWSCLGQRISFGCSNCFARIKKWFIDLRVSSDDLLLGNETMVEKLRENQQERKFYRMDLISLFSEIVFETIGYLFLKLFHSSNTISIKANLPGYLSIPILILIIYILAILMTIFFMMNCIIND